MILISKQTSQPILGNVYLHSTLGYQLFIEYIVGLIMLMNGCYSNSMKSNRDKIKCFPANKPSYSAYPTKTRKVSSNTDTISVDTVERTLRLNDKKATNRSISL